MARIQILELPSEEGDDGKIVTPFALIVDQYDEPITEHMAQSFTDFRERCGARGMLVFTTVVDVPGLSADDVAKINGRPSIGTVAVDVVPDLTGFEEAVRAAVEAIGPQEVGVHVGDKRIDEA